MEITMDMYESKIEELMNEYNKVSGIGTEYFNPTFFELFMTLIDYFYIEEVYDVKGNIIVASIFELFCDINNANIDILHEAFSKLRVKSNVKRVREIKEFFLDLIEMYKEMHFEDDGNSLDLDFSQIESMNDGEGEYYFNKYGTVIENNDQLGLMRQLDMFFKNQGMEKISVLDKDYVKRIRAKLNFQDEIPEYDILTSFYTEKLFEYDINNIGALLYNLILFYPLAYRTISHLLNFVPRDNIESLLECYIHSFERVNYDKLLELTKEFRDSQDFREYLFCIDGVGMIYKSKFEFNQAIAYIEKGLKYNDHSVIDFRLAILQPYMLTGNIEKYLSLRDTLDPNSIVRLYLELYDDVLEEIYSEEVYKKALNSSSLIMSAIVENVPNAYENGSKEEKVFFENFYHIFRSQDKLVSYLRKKFITRSHNH
jgi:hypothetical protein